MMIATMTAIPAGVTTAIDEIEAATEVATGTGINQEADMRTTVGADPGTTTIGAETTVAIVADGADGMTTLAREGPVVVAMTTAVALVVGAEEIAAEAEGATGMET
jgi:hypothetical protein